MTMRYVFDFVSPYAWVGWRPARALAERHGLELTPEPVLFAGLLDAHGNVGPAEVPAKRAYIFKDAYRKARARGLPPLVLPPAHPFNPLVALRAVTAAPSIALIDALFAAWYRTPRRRSELLEYTKAPLAVRAREAFVTWAASADE